MVHHRHGVVLCALLLCISWVVSGCKPASPSPSSWLSKSELAVSDALSQVATAQLTLEQVRKGQFLGRYPTVVLVYAEKTAGSASDKVTTMQPPKSEDKRFQQLSTQLSDAADLVTQARIALVDDDKAQFPRLIQQLRKTAKQLSTVDDQLKKAAGG